MIHEKDRIEFVDEHGNVLTHTTGGFVLPLLASLAPVVISEILKRFHPRGSGIGKVFLRHHNVHHVVKKTKGKGLVEDALTCLVPNVPLSGHGAVGFGGGIGFGASGHGVPHSTTRIHHESPIQYGEVMYPQGGVVHTQRRSRRVREPQLRTPRHGGFAVDQHHTNALTGFRAGRDTAMFPVNLPK